MAKSDPSLNLSKKRYINLDKFFYPKNVAIIGATSRKNSVGKTLLQNLLKSHIKIYPINPKRKKIFKIKTYPNIKSIKKKIDLAIIAIPAKAVLKAIEECIEAKVSSLIIVSAGFAEMGKEGIKLENKIKME